MILTVTLNPSVDISYPLETLKIDTVNRVKDVSKTASGKGLNVTRVLYESGDKVTATGFLGGKIGEFIESELEQSPVSPAFYKISGNTRNCIAILHEVTKQKFWNKDQQFLMKKKQKAFLTTIAILLNNQKL